MPDSAHVETVAEGTAARPVRVAYLFTRFPHATETFLQREVRAMRRLGVDLTIFSLHRGGSRFDEQPVERFNKWSLFRLFWLIPRVWFRQPALLTEVARRLFLTWSRDWLNHWENLYGAGIAVVWAEEFRRRRFDHLHAVWATLPATVAWLLARINGTPFSLGAHAYDLFEHGGDWLLQDKCAAARFVHTSTEAGRRRLLSMGVDQSRVIMSRRGLVELPPFRPCREQRTPLRLLCVARLVEKKGLLRQITLYQALRQRGLRFAVRIVGDGPLRVRLEGEIRARHLDDVVALIGELPHDRVCSEFAWADVLVHTGVVTSSGDRDGLPNVVPEAMAAGAAVVTAPAPGVLEAIEEGVTGLVCALDDVDAWQRALASVQSDDDLVARLTAAARRWVEVNFDATKNAALIGARFARSTSEPDCEDARCSSVSVDENAIL